MEQNVLLFIFEHIPKSLMMSDIVYMLSSCLYKGQILTGSDMWPALPCLYCIGSGENLPIFNSSHVLPAY